MQLEKRLEKKNHADLLQAAIDALNEKDRDAWAELVEDQREARATGDKQAQINVNGLLNLIAWLAYKKLHAEKQCASLKRENALFLKVRSETEAAMNQLRLELHSLRTSSAVLANVCGLPFLDTAFAAHTLDAGL